MGPSCLQGLSSFANQLPRNRLAVVRRHAIPLRNRCCRGMPNGLPHTAFWANLASASCRTNFRHFALLKTWASSAQSRRTRVRSSFGQGNYYARPSLTLRPTFTVRIKIPCAHKSHADTLGQRKVTWCPKEANVRRCPPWRHADFVHLHRPADQQPAIPKSCLGSSMSRLASPKSLAAPRQEHNRHPDNPWRPSGIPIWHSRTRGSHSQSPNSHSRHPQRDSRIPASPSLAAKPLFRTPRTLP